MFAQLSMQTKSLRNIAIGNIKLNDAETCGAFFYNIVFLWIFHKVYWIMIFISYLNVGENMMGKYLMYFSSLILLRHCNKISKTQNLENMDTKYFIFFILYIKVLYQKALSISWIMMSNNIQWIYKIFDMKL